MSDEGRAKGSGKREKPVVRGRRRRRTEPAGPQGRERAEAPRRRGREDQGQAASPTSRTDYTQAVGSGLPSGMRLPSVKGLPIWLLIGGLAVVCCCVLGAIMMLGGGAGGIGDVSSLFPSEQYEPFETPSPAATARPFVAPTRSAVGQDWLVMLYQDADDRILEKDIYVDLNEAELVGSSDRVQIVAQIDRFSGAFDGDGNWTSTKRFYVTQDKDLQRLGSQLVADLGELNMSDGDTLVDFVTWAMETFPADRQVLILSDHGMGWPGGWSDPAPGGSGDPSIPLASALGDQLYLMELDEALQEIRDRTGLDKFELVGLDACLMGHIEVMTALAPHARYAVLSQETEPALGWAYASFLEALQRDPDMTGAELSNLIVESYVEEDQRIVDDEARADLLRDSSPLAGLFSLAGPASADQLLRQMGQNSTLAALDLSAVPSLVDRINALSFALQEANQSEVARARTHALSFTSVFGEQVPPSYIDLGSFVQLLKQTRPPAAADEAADDVLAVLQQAVIAEKHGSARKGATGVSIYFPNSRLFGSAVAGPQSYTGLASRFASESLWDDFLAYHYTGQTFEASPREPTVPGPGTAISGPGAGAFELSSIDLSSTVAAPGRPVLLNMDIRGENVGYVLFFTGFYDRQSNSIFVADTDYIESLSTQEIDGVYYPIWPEPEFTLEFEWEPLMFAISDGTNSVTAALMPEDYGATFEEATYRIDGIYTYTSGESRYARLYFRDGWLRQVFGFTGENGTGSPREIYPHRGDRFTVLEKWLDLDAQGKVVQKATQQGGTLTFGNQMFSWEELDAAPGQYVLGFIVQDLDGNSYEQYATLEVE
ncbi:MAG TPA: clostripain-related cysteine peptidase [Anaerolineae bacterium]|nr:clostripain-related cysteine peptidase [Anaerolineae bacterium]